jgi:hypothetical protein
MNSLQFHGGFNAVLIEIAIVAAGLSGLYVIARAIRSAYRRGRQMAEITSTLAEIGGHFRPNAGSSLIDVVSMLRELVSQQGAALVELSRYSHDQVHDLRATLTAVPLMANRLDGMAAALDQLRTVIEDRTERVRSSD